MKVLNIRCHVGAQIGAQVYTSLDNKVHKLEMRMADNGVYLTGQINGKPIEPHFIPMSTIASVRLCPESYAQHQEPQVFHIEDAQLKRKPGRQPRADA